MSLPTYSQTYTSLVRLNKAVAKALYNLGKIEGKNALGSEEALLALVLSASKDIISELPCLQLEDDRVEEMDSKYCYLLDNFDKTF